jgi:hypothetical protein
MANERGAAALMVGGDLVQCAVNNQKGKKTCLEEQKRFLN